MIDNRFIFVAGLHRSGTSLVHEIIRSHPDISGISNSGVPQDEGQHLQSVVPTARAFGGPGKFAFDNGAYMDESHPLATQANAEALFGQWSQYFDLSSRYLVEKSPPTLLRTRFFQAIFPGSQFIAILRHPVAIALATQKWSKTSLESLLDHSLLAYEIFFRDLEKLDSVYLLRYEDLVGNPQGSIDQVFEFLGLDGIEIQNEVRADVNRKYFDQWKAYRGKLMRRIFGKSIHELEKRAKVFGYSLNDCERLDPVEWSGGHRR